MLRQNSSEVPSSFTPQWLQNRTSTAAQAQSSSPTAAARRDDKPWVAERWSNDKETDSKWGHDSPFDRSRAWAEDERDRERLVGGPRRDPARRKPNEWGVTGSTQAREAFAQDRWGDSSLRDPLREPSRSDRWRADDKTDKWVSRGDRLDLQESQTRERWRAPGIAGNSAATGARLDDRGFADRGGDRVSREEYRSPGEERLGPHKGRGFGYGRGRGAGAPLAPGSFDSWGSKDLNGLGGGSSLGRTSSMKRRPVQVYTMQHLEDLKDMMIYKLKVDELPLPKGLSVDTLAEFYKHYVDEHHEDEHEPQPEWVTEPVHPPGEGLITADAAVEEQPAAAAAAAPDAALLPPALVAAAAPAVPPAAPAAPPMPVLPHGMPLEALDADVWVYRDPSGNQQGPFNKADILDWLEAGYFHLDLPIRSALPGQEQVWSVLETMIVVWAHAGALKVQMSAAAAHQQQQQQDAAAPVVQLSTLSDVDSHLPQYREACSSGSVSAWLHQQPDPQQAVRSDHPEPHQHQQQAPVGVGFPAHAGAPWPGTPAMPFPGFMPPMGPGQPPSMPAAAGNHAARPAAAWAAPAEDATLFSVQQQHAALPSADAAISGAPDPQAPLFGISAFDGPRSLAAPVSAAAAPVAEQAPPQQRTLFGTPLEVPAQPAAATAATSSSSTGIKMWDLLFNSRPQEQQQQQQQQAAAPAAPAGVPATAAWAHPPPPPAAAVSEPEPDSSNWETVPTKAEKQHVKQAQHHKQQQAWQQPEVVGLTHPPISAAAATDAEDLSRAPSGPMAVPLFPPASKVEPPKPAPWAAAAPVAAAPPAKSLREIQEEEQARAAAQEAARAEEAARAAAAAGPAAAASAVAPAAGAGAWGRSSSAAAGGGGGGVPPGWGPTPAAAAVVKKHEPTRVASTDELPAPVKKATLGDILAARLGSSGRTASNASSTSAPAAGPWGAAAAAPRPAVNLNHIMQQEREETVTDLEGGAVEEDGLEDLIAALRQRNSAGQQQQAQQQAQQHSAAGEEGLFWDYSGSTNNVSSKAVPAAPVPLPRAAVAAAAAAAQPRPAAPAAAAPPTLATPWARAAASGAAALKAPPPGAQPAAPAAAGPGRPSAAAVVSRGNQQQPRAAAHATAAVPGAVFVEPAPAVRRQPAASPAAAPAAVPAATAAPTAESSGEGLLFGGLDLSPAFASWCKGQMQQLNGNDDMTMIEFLMGLPSNSEIAEYCQMVWGNKPGVSTFVSEFVKRKVAEQNRKPGGKKKKGGNAAAAATQAATAAGTGVSAAAVGLVHAGAANETWNKIPKKAGGKKKKGAKVDPSMLGFTSKLDLELLPEENE